MKVFQLNTVCGSGSVGRIAVDLYRLLEKNGHSCMIGYGRGTAPEDIRSYRVGSDSDMYLHGVLTRITDRHAFFSKRATVRLVAQMKEYRPDIVHLHNIHGYYLHIPTLFDYLSKADIPVVWTLHDCWAFTGHCACFEFAGCDRWRTHCHDCPQKADYPASMFLDSSSWNYEQKRAYFTSLGRIVFVTPSEWLAGLVRDSFLGRYPVQVIRNGIDREMFRPTAGNLKSRLGLENQIIVLGVANVWLQRKGLEDFMKLPGLLGPSYRIVLVGLTKKQVAALPGGIIGLERTESIEELAQLYSLADVFVNPTYEDNFPTTNLESLSCGTPVITYRTGGSVESIDPSCGLIVEKGDIDALAEAIRRMTDAKKPTENCLRAAAAYDRKTAYLPYLALYQRIFESDASSF